MLQRHKLFLTGLILTVCSQLSAASLRDRLYDRRHPPKILVYKVEPKTISPGQSATLTWQTQNARWVRITTLGAVQLSGSVNVKPTKTTSYQLTASNYVYSYTATVKVSVSQPEPIPPKPQPPVPPNTKQIMFIIETGQLDNLTASQRELLASLAFRDQLKQLGYQLIGVFDIDALRVGPSQYQPWVNALGKTPLPAILIRPQTGTIQSFKLPETIEECLKLIQTTEQSHADNLSCR